MALTAKKVYAILKRQISDMEAKIKTPIIYRGTVATADLLPLNPDIGDMYNIESKSVYGEAGMNVAWNGVVWDTMGAPIDMSLYIKSSELSDWVKQPQKPDYTADEVGALPADTKIPSKTSDLQNDSGFLTKIPDNYLSETDKTLSASGKAADAKATGDKIAELSADISNKLNKNQGSENSGKIAGINESGDIVPMFPVSVDYNEETNCLEFGSDQKMELNKGINLDSTLTKTGYAADAGAVGKITGSLKEDLVTRNILFNIIDGEYINYNDGAFQSNSGYQRTDYIWCYGISQIDVKTAIYTDASGLAFYDINKNFISGMQVCNTDTQEPSESIFASIDVPSGAYYFAFSILTYAINNKLEIFAKTNESSYQKLITPLTQDIINLKDVSIKIDKETISPTKINGGFVNASTKQISNLNVYFYTELYELKKGETISVTSKDPSGDVVARVSVWENEGATAATTILDVGTINTTTFIYTAPKTMLLRFSGFINNSMVIDKITPIVPSIQKHVFENIVDEKINQVNKSTNTHWNYALGDVICIGDSLMSGANYNEEWGAVTPQGASIQQNIPYYLGRMLNCNTTNAGKSGWSASDWWRDYINTPVYDFTKYDSAIIWLGTNYGCESMPTDEEITSFVPNTSVDASTANQALYLIEIIKHIKAVNNDCYIALCNCFASKSNVENNNLVITQIANKYNLQLIDMSDLSNTARPDLHANVANPHFGKAGNIFIANRIVNEVGNRINSNPLLAEFGYTARTN